MRHECEPGYIGMRFGVWPNDLPEDSPLRSLKAAHGCAIAAWKEASEVYREHMTDLLRTPFKRLKDAAEAVYKIQQATAERVDETFAAARAEIAALRKRMAAPQPATIAEALMDQEVRGLLRSLSPADLMRRLQRAKEQGDIQTIRAVADAPTILFPDLDNEQRERAKAWLQETTYPTEVQRIAALEKGIAVTVKAGTALLAHVAGLVDFRAANAPPNDARAAKLAEQSVEKELATIREEENRNLIGTTAVREGGNP